MSAGHIPELAQIVRALCAVAGRCWLPMVAAVAVTVAVSRVDILRFVCGLLYRLAALLVARPCEVRGTDPPTFRFSGRTYPYWLRSWSAAPPPIGLTAADPFAGGQVSRADLRVRSPGTLTYARRPAARSGLDAVPEAYHNLAAVWWGAFAASGVMWTRWSSSTRSLSPRSTSVSVRITSLEGGEHPAVLRYDLPI